MVIYYFSRVSITMADDYIKKLEYFYTVLVNSRPIMYRRDFYKVIDVQTKKIGIKSYITGEVVKYEEQRSQETLSDENKVEDIVLKNPLLARVRFIYDANESLLMYEEDKSHIPKESFIDRLYSILRESGRSELLPIVITPITYAYAPFLDRLKSMHEIKRITISLQPSNPNNRERWKKIDEKLKQDQITHYKEVQVNKNPQQGIKLDDETVSKILMGQDGYGTTTANGFDENGKKINITTKDSELQAKAEITGMQDIDGEIEQLQEKINDIKNKSDE